MKENWQVGIDGFSLMSEDEDGSVHAIGTAFVPPKKRDETWDYDEARRRARLMASAPDLFEALNHLVCSWSPEHVDNARKALARAKDSSPLSHGRQP